MKCKMCFYINSEMDQHLILLLLLQSCIKKHKQMKMNCEVYCEFMPAEKLICLCTVYHMRCKIHKSGFIAATLLKDG
jgi:hypothetical protein